MIIWILKDLYSVIKFGSARLVKSGLDGLIGSISLLDCSYKWSRMIQSNLTTQSSFTNSDWTMHAKKKNRPLLRYYFDVSLLSIIILDIEVWINFS